MTQVSAFDGSSEAGLPEMLSDAEPQAAAGGRRLRLRALSLAVLLLVVALSVTGCLVTRHVVSDQEHKLLQQRTEEAALYLSSLINSVQSELATLSASAAVSHEQPAAFESSAKLLTEIPNGFKGIALVRVEGTTATVVASVGSTLDAGLSSEAATAVTQAVAKLTVAPVLVGTPLFGGTPAERHIGFAYASPSLPHAAIYTESTVKPSASTPTTASQPFSELIAAVYAVPAIRADQLVTANTSLSDVPLRGDTVQVNAPIGAGQPWLLVTKARRSLVGSVANATPWAILAGGLLAALLATGIVETLARRRDYADELVALRTGELQESLRELATAHERLIRQERLAAIGQLASTVGHELRNPLGVLSNALYLLRADLGARPNAAAQRHLATADREVSAATLIVTDLLEYARARDPVPVDMDVVALVDEVISVLPPPTGVTVQRDLPSAPVQIRADRDMLRQVLLNLVGNAYQAMPDGGTVSVTVSQDGGSVRVGVADTGAGMSQEVRDRLFEPFFTTKARGVGLGLAVARRAVDVHGGDISVTSEPGEGTEFVVVLPRISAPRTSVDALERSEVSS